MSLISYLRCGDKLSWRLLMRPAGGEDNLGVQGFSAAEKLYLEGERPAVPCGLRRVYSICQGSTLDKVFIAINTTTAAVPEDPK